MSLTGDVTTEEVTLYGDANGTKGPVLYFRESEEQPSRERRCIVQSKKS